MSKQLVYDWERKLSKVFPGWMNKRAQSRLKLFRAEAALATRARAAPLNKMQQNPESSTYARDRIQLMLDARDLEENSPMVSAIQLSIEEYGYGKVQYCSRTGGGLEADREYNQFFAEWAKCVTADGRFSLERAMQLGGSSASRDGDIGAVVVDGNSNDSGLPRIAPIECDRIGNIYAAQAYQANYVSGFHLGSRGEIVSVDVYDRGDCSYTRRSDPIPGNQFLHWTNATRFDAYRGVTGYRPVLSHFRDVKEIIEAEIMAVKWASGINGIVERDGLAVEGEDFFQGDGGAMSGATKLDKLEPGRTEYLEPGEKFTQFQSSRPTPAWQGLIQLVLRLGAMGLGLPYSFIFDASGVMGTATRLDSARAQRAFHRHQRRGKDAWLEPLKDLVIAIGLATKQIRPTPNPYNGTFLFAAHPTVDIGRESQANLAENKQGLKTAMAIYGEQGQNVFDEQEQLAVEAANILELSKKYQVPVSMIQTLAKEGRTDADPVQGIHGADAEQAAADAKQLSRMWSAFTTDSQDMDPEYRVVWLEESLKDTKAGSPLEQHLMKELSDLTKSKSL